MPESKSAMQCLSASVVLAIKNIYGVKIPEEFLLVEPGFLNIQLDKENLTFDSNVNDIVLNYIGHDSTHDTTVKSLYNAPLNKDTLPLVINLPVRYLKYASVYTTSDNLNYHHFVLLTSMEKEKLNVFDSRETLYQNST